MYQNSTGKENSLLVSMVKSLFKSQQHYKLHECEDELNLVTYSRWKSFLS